MASSTLLESEKITALEYPASCIKIRACKMAHASAVNTEASVLSLYLKLTPSSGEYTAAPTHPPSSVLEPSVYKKGHDGSSHGKRTRSVHRDASMDVRLHKTSPLLMDVALSTSLSDRAAKRSLSGSSLASCKITLIGVDCL
ncbi:PREDICTED: uncharacterized protein LOC108765645 [Trachymyrmex cornetzi]|uniref:uncharacterized protein LOC108765645 n=1 Tax=Trachymyrmex cornetzi TaxID=471704 RepID=UPI00084F3CA2|nr:PREDICTED: uncharacterized protein LOC108765645 [Trachymyrmex cornetzi]